MGEFWVKLRMSFQFEEYKFEFVSSFLVDADFVSTICILSFLILFNKFLHLEFVDQNVPRVSSPPIEGWRAVLRLELPKEMSKMLLNPFSIAF